MPKFTVYFSFWKKGTYDWAQVIEADSPDGAVDKAKTAIIEQIINDPDVWQVKSL